MASSGTASTAASASTATIDHESNNPLWAYTTREEKITVGGGNMLWQCNFCNIKFSSSYTRVKAHLLKLLGQGIGACKVVTSADLTDMQKLEDETEKRLQMNMPRKVPLTPSTTMSGLFSRNESKKRNTGSGSLEKAFNMGVREQMSAEVARAFYSTGLPFHLSRNPYFRSMIQFACNNSLAGYKCPCYNRLRTTLLQKGKANIDRLLSPTHSIWAEKGVSIVSDGWSDSQRRPLINFIAVTDGQLMFIKAIDCSGERKDNRYIANLFTQVINEVGADKVVQIIIDNATNCKGAGQLIEAQFSNIIWTPCVVYTLNLAMKNICSARNIENNEVTYGECSWIIEIVGDAIQIRNFIMNHGMRLAMFNEFVKLKLLVVAETRFASAIVMLRRFKLIKVGLQAMVISNKWSCYQEDDQGKARFVKENVLDDR